MCKAHVLLQLSPFGGERVNQFIFYSPNHRPVLEALRETVSSSQRCLFFLFNVVYGIFPQNFGEANVFLNDACFFCHCAVLELPVIFTKVFTAFINIFYFPNEELSLTQRVLILYFEFVCFHIRVLLLGFVTPFLCLIPIYTALETIK